MITINVNGQSRQLDVDPETPLLWALRDDLKLTGTKFGCGMAQCGACTVHLDGQPIRSCQLPVGSIGESAITTIEGLNGKVAEAVTKAWRDLDVVQCGYCQSGQIMSAVALLNETPKPTDDDIDAAMDGNICRCATYVRIRKAIKAAASTLEA
ncbi:(2Fe-2S)-binding protein [Pedomonas mirosovicensis]|uniref:(2Fe-2S)-binding protein n=1 Tax=Pedomonas mirosovicensis TaxID=2908641 RepID=UPI0021677B37|nr:(2Fe-2S)-binding protein [Pedomonas mirosovicensis]MCH8684953.1 (2Fe-2S)-binding protein [Pedomonas mirosovicensis]